MGKMVSKRKLEYRKYFVHISFTLRTTPSSFYNKTVDRQFNSYLFPFGDFALIIRDRQYCVSYPYRVFVSPSSANQSSCLMVSSDEVLIIVDLLCESETELLSTQKELSFSGWYTYKLPMLLFHSPSLSRSLWGHPCGERQEICYGLKSSTIIPGWAWVIAMMGVHPDNTGFQSCGYWMRFWDIWRPNCRPQSKFAVIGELDANFITLA
jgi:hypothetical protein